MTYWMLAATMPVTPAEVDGQPMTYWMLAATMPVTPELWAADLWWRLAWIRYLDGAR